MRVVSGKVAPSLEGYIVVLVTFAMTLLALFAPYIVSYQRWLGSNRYLITAVTWSFINLDNALNPPGWAVLFLLHIETIPFLLLIASPRLFYVLVISRHLQGKSQPREFLLASALLVFQLLTLCVFYYFNPFYIELLGGPVISRLAPPVGSLICLPVPILLCFGLLVMGYWRSKSFTPKTDM